MTLLLKVPLYMGQVHRVLPLVTDAFFVCGDGLIILAKFWQGQCTFIVQCVRANYIPKGADENKSTHTKHSVLHGGKARQEEKGAPEINADGKHYKRLKAGSGHTSEESVVCLGEVAFYRDKKVEAGKKVDSRKRPSRKTQGMTARQLLTSATEANVKGHD
ncbi:hypothetical protein BaRGS_00023872 [Batillaria attramentaria]|uniref:Uncharacterized protein n=1 Tax=Batillaria attramentaria TaxID=370345 RepID=A0ABD0KCK5_9CAEN